MLVLNGNLDQFKDSKSRDLILFRGYNFQLTKLESVDLDRDDLFQTIWHLNWNLLAWRRLDNRLEFWQSFRSCVNHLVMLLQLLLDYWLVHCLLLESGLPNSTRWANHPTAVHLVLLMHYSRWGRVAERLLLLKARSVLSIPCIWFWLFANSILICRGHCRITICMNNRSLNWVQIFQSLGTRLNLLISLIDRWRHFRLLSISIRILGTWLRKSMLLNVLAKSLIWALSISVGRDLQVVLLLKPPLKLVEPRDDLTQHTERLILELFGRMTRLNWVNRAQ